MGHKVSRMYKEYEDVGGGGENVSSACFCFASDPDFLIKFFPLFKEIIAEIGCCCPPPPSSPFDQFKRLD